MTAAATPAPEPKSAQTRARILEAALDLFRAKGFAAATMREVAAAAGVATGAAYYYFPSKESIVLAFYDRAREEMSPLIAAALAAAGPRLEDRLRALIAVKLDYFAPNRNFLGALLGSTADPQNPLSPFSTKTAAIRDFDFASFDAAIAGGNVKPPKDLAPHLAHLLWMYQMAVIFFWLTDTSGQQQRTRTLLDKSARMLVQLLKLAGLPLMRPVRRSVLDLVELVKGV
jgi:AcrR family transcriptional regulator